MKILLWIIFILLNVLIREFNLTGIRELSSVIVGQLTIK
jgi:hypothetical protein